MTVMTQIVLAIALVLSIILPFGYYLIGEKNLYRLLPAQLTAVLLPVWDTSQQLL